MGKTISTHNGSAAHRGHNVRDRWAVEKQEHIDPALSRQNVILHDEKPREAYQRIFGDALQKYNEKQERPERRIKDYYAHIEKDAKKNAVYEMIIQVGDRNDTGLDAPAERECLIQFYEGWKERNPNLECIGAYLHADEKDGTVHMHIDYVPVARGYKRGMETQTGLVKALGEMGFQKQGKETAQIQWERRENAALEAICMEHGIEVEHPGRGEKHLDTALYKVKQELEQTRGELEDLQDELEIAETELDNKMELALIWEDRAGQAQAKAEEAQKTVLQTRERIDETREEAAQVSRRVRELTGEVNDLEAGKTALEGEISVLEGQKAELSQEVPALAAQISEAKDELATVERAIKGKTDEGAAQFGMGEMQRRIAAARQEAEKERRLNLLERFVARLDIAPLWERFCTMEKGKSRGSKDRRQQR